VSVFYIAHRYGVFMARSKEVQRTVCFAVPNLRHLQDKCPTYAELGIISLHFHPDFSDLHPPPRGILRSANGTAAFSAAY